MGWSKETLTRFVPILAAGVSHTCTSFEQQHRLPISRQAKRTTKILPFSVGLPYPDGSVRLPARAGKVTLLFQALRPFISAFFFPTILTPSPQNSLFKESSDFNGN